MPEPSIPRVSIPVWCDWWRFFKNIYCFNATFQFQYGAIGGHNRSVLQDTSILFQFQYGAIGGDMLEALKSIVDYVSIPVWCDWWFTKAAIDVYCSSFQFQYGAIGGKNFYC